jgi:ABC-2 type transport system ATP-binding protein
MALDEHAPPLAVSQVSAGYGKKVVISDVTFTLDRQEIFGLVGLNGAGKTTLIRTILSLRAGSGQIAIFGEPNTLAKSRQRLLYLPERFQPPIQLKGFEYLSILLEYFGQRLDRARARDMATGIDLDPAALDRQVRTYSKGMGQKLGLVGAFLVDVPLMILDEPMSGLDPRARVLLKDRLIERRAAGRTIFFSSHILSDIEEICDRIGVINDGRLLFLGTPTAFVAQHPGATLERSFLSAIESSPKLAPGPTSQA